MKTRTLLLGIATLVVTASGCAATYQEDSPRTYAPRRAGGGAYFYDELAPYGRWIDYAPYGRCWAPNGVYQGWRPYSDGHWIYTDWGWTWASYEPWGWAPYHYGRWLYDPIDGWLWVPGSVWAPAWVAWHDNDDWVGWAPLPPAALWDASAGLQFSDVDRIPSSSWCFVRQEDLSDASLRAQVVATARNDLLLSQTHDATRFLPRAGRPVNQGIDVALMERAGRTIQRLKVANADSPAEGRGLVVNGGVVQFFRPDFRGLEAREQQAHRLPPRAVGRPTPTVSPREREPVLVAPRTSPGAVAVLTPARERKRDADRRKLEESLAKELVRLERQQARELHSGAKGRTMDQILQRQAAEKQAFEDRAAAKRQQLERRYQNDVGPRSKGAPENPPEEKHKGDRPGEGSQG